MILMGRRTMGDPNVSGVFSPDSARRAALRAACRDLGRHPRGEEDHAKCGRRDGPLEFIAEEVVQHLVASLGDGRPRKRRHRWQAGARPTCACSVCRVCRADGRAHEVLFGPRAQNLHPLVHHRLRHAADLVLLDQVGVLARLDDDGGDLGVLHRHAIRQADRPGTVRSRRGDEYLERERRCEAGQ